MDRTPWRQSVFISVCHLVNPNLSHKIEIHGCIYHGLLCQINDHVNVTSIIAKGETKTLSVCCVNENTTESMDMIGHFQLQSIPENVSKTFRWAIEYATYPMLYAHNLHFCVSHLPLDKMADIMADDIFKCIFLNENYRIPMQIPLKFVPRSPINNKVA